MDDPEQAEAADGEVRIEGEPPSRRRRRVIVVALVVVAVLVAASSWFVFGGERARQQSEDAARARLGSSPGSGTAAPGTPPEARLGQPPAVGLYRYTGEGDEDTSFPPLTEKQGPQMPATVTVSPGGGQGCRVLRIDYNNHHWQEWTYCTSGGELREIAGTSYSRRDVGRLQIDNTSPFVCDPPVVVLTADEAPGSTHPRRCVGTSSVMAGETVSAGTITLVGDETLDIQGTSVLAAHVREELTLTGSQTGSEITELWFDLRTGLPLRNKHDLRVVTGTPVGDITYRENASFELQSLDPA